MVKRINDTSEEIATIQQEIKQRKDKVKSLLSVPVENRRIGRLDDEE